jgi:hypothetical protein
MRKNQNVQTVRRQADQERARYFQNGRVKVQKPYRQDFLFVRGAVTFSTVPGLTWENNGGLAMEITHENEDTFIGEVARIAKKDPDFNKKLFAELEAEPDESTNRVSQKERKDPGEPKDHVDLNVFRMGPLIMLIYTPIIALGFANGQTAGAVATWGGLILLTFILMWELPTRADMDEILRELSRIKAMGKKKKIIKKKSHKIDMGAKHE